MSVDCISLVAQSGRLESCSGLEASSCEASRGEGSIKKGRDSEVQPLTGSIPPVIGDFYRQIDYPRCAFFDFGK